MRREIVMAPEAVEDFRSLKANVRAEVQDAIERHLRYQPAKATKKASPGRALLKIPQLTCRFSVCSLERVRDM